MRRHRIGRLTLTATAVLATVLVPATAQAAPYCGLAWGSQPEVGTRTAPPGTELDAVRAGRHACFDRLVIDLDHAPGYRGYDVRYVPQVTQDGSGRPVALRGGAALQVVVHTTVSDDSGRPVYTPPSEREVVDVSGYSTLRQVAWAGAFEGQTTLGVGTRARLPFRVVVLPGPGSSEARVVIDVAHRW